MTIRNRVRVVFLVVTLVAGGSLATLARQQSVQAPPAAAGAATAKIPADPQITTGQFRNGLHYYVRTNKEPKDRAELRLVVNAGSVLEDDDQRGLAHLVEHMAFNGTTHFPGMGIVNFLQSIGMRFGRDLNAYTSFDETVYMLEVPTDKPEVMEQAMLVLEDWAHNLTFDPTEIDKERGVVTEEWRLGRGADARLRDKTLPVIVKGSRYADRLPIGDMNVVQHAPYARLKQFYADWYRPDLMAVIAVGDFDRPAMQALIEKHFAAIPEPANPKPRPSYPVPGHDGTLYAIATDKEQPSTSVTVYNTFPQRDETTFGYYRQQLVEGLYSAALSARLQEIARKPNAPFLGAGVQRGSLVRTSEASIDIVSVKDGAADAGLDAVFTEIMRVAQFGFTATELDRVKTRMLRGMESAVAEKDNEESASYADEYGSNFLTGEPIPGIVYENELYKRFLPDITIAEVNALAKEWSPDRNRAVVVTAPDKAGVTVPTERQLASDMTSASSKKLTAYVDTVDTQPLLASVPAAGTITNTTTKDAWGITEWTLSNGARVVLKPTTFKADQVLLNAYSPGGTSLASDADYIAATTASQVVNAGGLANFNTIDLRKVLTGKAASVRPFIGANDSGISGSASPKDLETLFQLAYMTFTEPRRDPDIFSVLTTQAKSQLANQESQPDYAFSVAMNAALTQNAARTRPMTVARVDEMSLDKSMSFYKARFADASNFTFVLVGSFDLAAARPLVEKYLASLPATHGHETWKDTGIRPPKGVVNVNVAKGIEPKSQEELVFTGPFQYDQAHRIAMRAMTTVLGNRLRDVLREDLSGTYSVSVSPGYSKIPRQEYRVTIAFGSAPDRNKALVDRLMQEIQKFKTDGPTAQELKDTKEQLARDLETNMRDNGFFLQELTARYEFGEDLKDLFGLADFYNALDAATIQNAAKQYLDTSNMIQGTLMPEK